MATYIPGVSGNTAFSGGLQVSLTFRAEVPAFLKLQTSQTVVLSSLLRLSPQNFHVGGPAVALDDARGRVRDGWSFQAGPNFWETLSLRAVS